LPICANPAAAGSNAGRVSPLSGAAVRGRAPAAAGKGLPRAGGIQTCADSRPWFGAASKVVTRKPRRRTLYSLRLCKARATRAAKAGAVCIGRCPGLHRLMPAATNQKRKEFNMNTLVIVLIAAVCLVGAYALYGRWIARSWGIDPTAKTP